MEKINRCIHQIFRPKDYTPSWIRPGCGDCKTCQPCPYNIKCSQYKSFTITVIDNPKNKKVSEVNHGKEKT